MSFAYGEGPTVIDDVSLTIEPGERLALVGPTGAGKSTVAKLIARLYDPVDGSVSFGGVDLRDATMAGAAAEHRDGAPGGPPLRGHGT